MSKRRRSKIDKAAKPRHRLRGGTAFKARKPKAGGKPRAADDEGPRRYQLDRLAAHFRR